jgi:hypothetical protein
MVNGTKKTGHFNKTEKMNKLPKGGMVVVLIKQRR